MKAILRMSLALGLVLVTTLSWAQDRTVTGAVTSGEDGEVLIGVNVILKGTTTGTITDIDGNFNVSVPADGGTLVFSFIGFATQEIPIGASAVVDVVLLGDATQLGEIVVTGSAVGKSKETLSFSVGTIDETLMTTVPAPNLATGLQGKVAGLRVNNVGGQPGEGAYFQIRSATSISNGQAPLVIVDGVFMNQSTLADLNAEDIERVEVLKGSAGASLYGSQAANGVIQIFTRRGKGLDVGDTKITYRGEFGWAQEAARYDVNNWTNRATLNPGDVGYDPAFADQPQFGPQDPTMPVDHEIPNLQDYQEDWMFTNGAMMTNYVAVQGRSDQTNFMTSFQHMKQDGVIKFNNGYERNAFRLNVDHRISDKFDVQISSMYSTSERDLQDNASSANSSYWGSLMFLFPAYNLDRTNEEDGSPFDYDVDKTGFGTQNPVYDVDNMFQTVNRTRILGNMLVNYDITDWLQFNTGFGIDRSENRYEHFINKGFLSNLSNAGPVFGNTYIFGNATPEGGVSNGGGINRTGRINQSVVARTNLVAQKTFGDWNTAFRLSYLYEDLTTEFNGGIGENLAVNEIRSLDNAISNKNIQSQASQIVANSFFLIGDIDYQRKYIFSGLIRREGSSLFGPDERWANYYRLSGAYRITEDVEIPGFQELKVRASIGTAGVRPLYEQRFETFALQNGTSQKNTLGNRNLRPSQSTEIEVGFNTTFARAFDLEFSYSNTVTEDQILLVPLSGAAGFSGQWRNAGTLEADIIEAALNIDIGQLAKFSNGWSWTFGVNFDRVKQEITKLDVPRYLTGPGFQQTTFFMIDQGLPFGTIWGETYATSIAQLEGQINSSSSAQPSGEFGQPIDPNDYEINELGFVVMKDGVDPTQNTTVPYKLRDANGGPLTGAIGDINPDFRMGINTTVGYKGLSLYSLFDYKKGGDIYNMTKQWMSRDNRHGDSQNPNVDMGFFGSNGLYNVLVAHSGVVEDGTFFMLRELSLSYEFPREMLSNIGWIESLRLSFVSRNLFTITDYTGFHPDVSSAPQDENRLTSGRFATNAAGVSTTNPGGDPNLFVVDNFAYPVSKTFAGSVQITF